jgi:Flp pilus assembly protein TadB
MNSEGSDPQTAMSGNVPHVSFWVRELPFSLAFILTILGVAYTTFTKHPVIGYWTLLAPVIGVVCVSTGWRRASDHDARMRLIWTQALHWIAFLVAMNVLFLPDVQRLLNANASGLATLTLLALGTFTAGVHVSSWQVCLLGIFMALAVPAIAWIEESALIYALLTVTALGIGIVFWWHLRETHRRAANHPAHTA